MAGQDHPDDDTVIPSCSVPATSAAGSTVALGSLAREAVLDGQPGGAGQGSIAGAVQAPIARSSGAVLLGSDRQGGGSGRAGAVQSGPDDQQARVESSRASALERGSSAQSDGTAVTEPNASNGPLTSARIGAKRGRSALSPSSSQPEPAGSPASAQPPSAADAEGGPPAARRRRTTKRSASTGGSGASGADEAGGPTQQPQPQRKAGRASRGAKGGARAGGRQDKAHGDGGDGEGEAPGGPKKAESFFLQAVSGRGMSGAGSGSGSGGGVTTVGFGGGGSSVGLAGGSGMGPPVSGSQSGFGGSQHQPGGVSPDATRRALAEARAEAEQLKRRLEDGNRELERSKEELRVLRRERDEAGQRAALTEGQLEQERIRQGAQTARLAGNLERLVRTVIDQEMRESLRALSEKQYRLGRSVARRSGMGMHSQVVQHWEEGQAFRDLRADLRELQRRKEELDKRRKEITKVSRALKSKGGGKSKSKLASSSAASGDGSDVGPSPAGDRYSGDMTDASMSGSLVGMSSVPGGPPRLVGQGRAGRDTSTPAGEASLPGGLTASIPGLSVDQRVLAELRHTEQDEQCRVQQAILKREDAKLQERKKQLLSEHQLLLRETKRIRDEQESRFAPRPVLHTRYLLMSLLGKGGFSEVWRAMDLHTATEVAVKVHQLSQQWNEDRRQNYIRHASREYQIHRQLKHPNIVELHDVFEISNDAFATVLEYCGGTDLDRLLKQHRTLPEREARTIVLQVLAALRYLNQVGRFGGAGGYDESLALAAEAKRASTPTGGRVSRGGRSTRGGDKGGKGGKGRGAASGAPSSSSSSSSAAAGPTAGAGQSQAQGQGQGQGQAEDSARSPAMGAMRAPSPPGFGGAGGFGGRAGLGGAARSGIGVEAGQGAGLDAVEIPLASMMMSPGEQGIEGEIAPGTHIERGISVGISERAGAGVRAGGTSMSASGAQASGADGGGVIPPADQLQGRRVIHFDLKPANILLTDDRMVKVTDFGLSKIFEDRGQRARATAGSGAAAGAGSSPGRDGGVLAAARQQHHASEMTSMELTSQGAGTYWYLPPECFQLHGPTPPRISDKVDVWSLGVIFYQMLFGKRPFGEGQTQEQIYRDKVILNARSVEFPPPGKPAVSKEAQNFIRRCLTFDQRERPGVREISADPYLTKKLSGK